MPMTKAEARQLKSMDREAKAIAKKATNLSVRVRSALKKQMQKS